MSAPTSNPARRESPFPDTTAEMPCPVEGCTATLTLEFRKTTGTEDRTGLPTAHLRFMAWSLGDGHSDDHGTPGGRAGWSAEGAL